MTGGTSHAVMSLPPDERPAAHQRGDDDASHLMPSLALDAPPTAPNNVPLGAILPITTIGATLDEAMMTLADVKLAVTEGNLAALEAHLSKIAALASHACKTVTQARVRQRQKE